MQKQYVIFELALQKYALQIELVNEITNTSDITPMPNMNPYIAGMVNLRGQVIPLIKLSKIFGCEAIEKTTHQIVIVNTMIDQVGLIIDQAKDVKTFEEEQIEPISPIIGSKYNYVSGTISIEQELIQVVDIDQILASCN